MQPDTTHIWKAAFKASWFAQLSEYKKVDGQWWVYSDITGWRKSNNDDEWFDMETKEGYFVSRNTEP